MSERGKYIPGDKLARRVATKFQEAAAAQRTRLQLSEVPPDLGPEDWEIFAFGPYQTEEEEPGRIIAKDQTAYIAIVVWMNPAMCRTITTHGDKIELNIWTSDMQRMDPVDELSHYCCIKTERGHCWYVYVWEFKPTQDACVYQTNICARICTCSNVALPGYAGFVRHVYDFDVERLWPYPPPGERAAVLPPGFPTDEWPEAPQAPGSWGHDRPIRYMVYDPDIGCECGEYDVEPNNFCKHVLSSAPEEDAPEEG
jgi:hypothetical protein